MAPSSPRVPLSAAVCLKRKNLVGLDFVPSTAVPASPLRAQAGTNDGEAPHLCPCVTGAEGQLRFGAAGGHQAVSKASTLSVPLLPQSRPLSLTPRHSDDVGAFAAPVSRWRRGWSITEPCRFRFPNSRAI